MSVELTPEKQSWIDEAMSRAKPLTVFQLDLIRSELRRVATHDRIAA
jgi:hypothetical protein